MPTKGWTPSIVPNGDDQNVYIVLDDFGRNGRAYRETDVERADLEAVIMDLLEGEYKDPIRVVGFNTAEKWSQDLSADVAHELRRRCDLQMRDVPFHLEDFVERREGRYHAAMLWASTERVSPIRLLNITQFTKYSWGYAALIRLPRFARSRRMRKERLSLVSRLEREDFAPLPD
jgi:hypothetical protein